LDAEDVVVGREHAESGFRNAGLRLDSDLSIVNTGEVARPGWLMFFWLEREGVRVDTWRWGTGVVHEWLHGVEVLAGLLLEAILAVEDQLEGIEGTVVFFGEVLTLEGDEWDTSEGGGDEAVRFGSDTEDVRGDIRVGVRGAEGVFTVVQAPDKFLDWVVVGETLLDFRTGGDGFGTGGLDLLDEGFVTLFGKSASFLRIKIHVICPNLERGTVGNTAGAGLEVGGQIEIQSDFVVLEGDQRQRQSWVAVEEKDEWQEDLTILERGGGHLTVVSLLGLIQVKLGVQTPPLLVVLIDALATDREFDILDGTFRDPRIVGSSRLTSLHFDVHIGDQVTITGNGDGDAAIGTWGTVDGLFDVFHREVGVTLVHRLEESNLGVTREIDILGTIGDELHEATSHCESFCTIYQENNFAKKLNLIFPGVLYNV